MTDWDHEQRFHRYLEDLPWEAAEQLTSRHFTHFSNVLRYLDNNQVEIHSGLRGFIPLPAAIRILKKMQRNLEPIPGQAIRDPEKQTAAAAACGRLLAQFIARKGQYDSPPAPAALPPPDVSWRVKPAPRLAPLPPPERAPKDPSTAKTDPSIKTSAAVQASYLDRCPVCSTRIALSAMEQHLAEVHQILRVNCLHCGGRMGPSRLVDHLLAKHRGELEDARGIARKSAQKTRLKSVPMEEEPRSDHSPTLASPPLLPSTRQQSVHYIAAEDPQATLFERFCLALPPEMVELFDNWKLGTVKEVVRYLFDRRIDVYNDRGNIRTEEAVLVIHRLREMDAEIEQVRYLHDYLSSSKHLVRKIHNRLPIPYKFICPGCNKSVPIEWMPSHLASQHPRRGILPCPFCPESLTPDRYGRHLLAHHRTQLWPVHARVCMVIEEQESLPQAPAAPSVEAAADQPAKELPPVSCEGATPPAEKRALKPIRSTHLQLQSVVRRARTKMLRMAAGTEDRLYVISQAARVKTERANRLHAKTLAVLTGYLAAHGVQAGETFLIDAYAQICGPQIFEVKSCNPSNEKSQVRHAVAQLYEYRFLYGLHTAGLWLVLSEAPRTPWLLDYLTVDRLIGVLWLEDGRLVGHSLPKLEALIPALII